MATVEADLRGSRLAGQRGDRAAPSPSAFQPPVRQSGLARRGGEPSAHPSLLHVTNGESAANTLRQTGIGGAVLPWQDALHEGPAPAAPRDTGVVSVRVRVGEPARTARLARTSRQPAGRRDARRPAGRALVRA